MPDGAHGPIRHPWEEPPAEGAAHQVAEGVLWLRLPLPMALDHVNVFALDDGDGWTLVDTGLNSRRTRAALEAAMAGPLGGRPVRRVLVTHHHPDHVGLAGWLQSVHGAELLMPRTGWLFARMLTLDVQEVPAPESLTFWRRAGMDAETMATRTAERPFNFADIVWPMPLGFTRIAEGCVLRAGGRTWDVRMGDGHAPEHATLWSRDDGLVIGGDQLLPSISANIGVYATEPGADPLTDWIASCARLAVHAREDQLVLPGHKLPYTGLPARLEQMVENHHGALARLRLHLAEPRTAVECFAPLFKRRIGPAEYGLALVEAVAHLNHLHRAGETERTERADGAWVHRLRG
jgi:glyoxylase-like metal-dependent hydrolase (beta-lactamase superfamily II)